MSGQLWFMLGVGVLAGLGGGVPLGRWRRRHVLGRARDEAYEDGYTDGYNDAHDARDEWDRGREAREQAAAEPPPTLVGHTIYPELVALAQEYDELSNPPADLQLRAAYENPTPAQRRRDKHKQRGPWAPGDLPDPPTDVGAWWQAELDALLLDGQSEWLTRNLVGAA